MISRPLLVVFLSLVYYSCLAKESITVGFEHLPPYQSINAQGEVVGIDIDIIKLILNDAGFDVSFKKMPWKRQLLVGIHSGEIDIMLNATQTPEREQFAYFSEQPYMFDDNALFIRRKDADTFANIKTLSDLQQTNLKIGMVLGTVYTAEFDRLANDEKFKQQLFPVVRDIQNINLLISGRIDAFLASDLVIAHYLQQRSDKTDIIRWFYANKNIEHGGKFMFSKASLTIEEVNRINVSLKKLLTNGSISALIRQYSLPGYDQFSQ